MPATLILNPLKLISGPFLVRRCSSAFGILVSTEKTLVSAVLNVTLRNRPSASERQTSCCFVTLPTQHHACLHPSTIKESRPLFSLFPPPEPKLNKMKRHTGLDIRDKVTTQSLHPYHLSIFPSNISEKRISIPRLPPQDQSYQPQPPHNPSPAPPNPLSPR